MLELSGAPRGFALFRTACCFPVISLVFHVEFPLEDSPPALPVEFLFDCARMCFE